MRTPHLGAALLGTALAGVLALTGCTPANHGDEARGLRDELRGMEGVDTVALRYDQPELLDAADVDLSVAMLETASPDDVAAAVRTAYEGLTDAHFDEEGNVALTWRDDTLSLRTFESEAEPEDVAEAARIGAEIAAAHPEVAIALMAQWVGSPPHVRTSVRLRLPRGTTRAEAGRVREAIKAAYGDLPVEPNVGVDRR